MKISERTNRRNFLSGMAAASAVVLLPETAGAATDTGISMLGPKPGYTPQVGTLVSMLTWMQPAATGPVRGLTQSPLDYLFDANANSIGLCCCIWRRRSGSINCIHSTDDVG
ncbi:MAG TPA: hypothetical protein VGG81_09520 [Edaphobacter sp.]